MKKMIGAALVFFAVVEMMAPDWWIAVKAEVSKKIDQVKTK